MKDAALNAVVLVTVMWAAGAAAQCTKDSECKGDRVCEDGKCVSPKQHPAEPAFSPPPPPPPQPQPASQPGPSSQQPPPPPPPPPPMQSGPESQMGEPAQPQPFTFVSDFGVRGEAFFASPNGSLSVLPGAGLHGQFGIRLTSLVAIVGAGNAELIVGPGGSILIGAIAPGIRVGNDHHVTLSIGPEFLSFASAFGGGTLLAAAGHVRLDGVVVVIAGFSIQAQAALHFDGNGVQGFVFGLGAGWSTF